ncbi:unnamed protein product [Phyllotreta striolata]|uniref:Nbr1 FW domain-containing protein n=1 Tax=Phyllotreta striolata TaxID=444603 RepID=A0A9N9XJK8_PHYSR|nr:unnamed protein product [Phyllotreta striolata]
MGPKNKDLEIIYSLKWKNKSGNGGDKANIIGMYDIPATTLKWEVFKSYLLKNSGTVGEDVKVSYITDSNREFPIESQTDFEIALYAFRRKGRMGDVVNLKLDRISDPQQRVPSTRHSNSNDVETQFDTEAVSIVSSCCNSENPPEWFISYMNKFKKNMTEEINTAISSALSNIKTHSVSQPSCYHSRKTKSENSKRRKLQLLTGDGPHESTKDLIKSLKLENKLEQKLEKLENKSKKWKEKKLALVSKSSDSDVAVCSNAKRRQSVPCEGDDYVLQMNATPVNTQEIVPHMLGGEIYLHQWKVINSGKLQWNSDTNLMFTWGSKALKALDTLVPVPHLKSGETGTISVRLQIPHCPGQYECYFHFHHKNRRFGQWLGCQVIVDPFDLKGNKCVLDTSYGSTFNVSSKETSAIEDFNISNPVTRYDAIWKGNDAGAHSPTGYSFNLNDGVANKTDLFDEQAGGLPMEKVVRELSSRVEDMKLQDPTDTNCSSDSDNQSIVSLSESNSSKGIQAEFVVVPVPDCFKLDEPLTPKKVDLIDNGSCEAASKSIVTGASEGSSVKSQEEKPVGTIEAEKSQENFDDNNNEDTKNNSELEKDEFQDAISQSPNKSDIVMITLPEANQDNQEYACVMVDGQKVMIPKQMIKSEYLPAAKSSDGDEKSMRSGSSSPFAEVRYEKDDGQTKIIENSATTSREASEQPAQFDEVYLNSHCSAAGSCFSEANADKNTRLFIFPQACPGYEVIQGTDAVELDANEYDWTKSDSHYAYCTETKDALKSTLSNPQSSANNNPFTNGSGIPHVPNFQQTPLEERRVPSAEEIRMAFEENAATLENSKSVNCNTFIDGESAPQPSAPVPETRSEGTSTARPVVHILPEGLVNGAVSVARSVMNRIVPQQPGRWVNGHWVSTDPRSTREANLQALAEMGFWNRDLNATLLARYSDDLSRVVGELVQ